MYTHHVVEKLLLSFQHDVRWFYRCFSFASLSFPPFSPPSDPMHDGLSWLWDRLLFLLFSRRVTTHNRRSNGKKNWSFSKSLAFHLLSPVNTAGFSQPKIVKACFTTLLPDPTDFDLYCLLKLKAGLSAVSLRVECTAMYPE